MTSDRIKGCFIILLWISFSRKLHCFFSIAQYLLQITHFRTFHPLMQFLKDDVFIPIVLQGSRGKKQSLANLPFCEVDFSFKKRTMSLSDASDSIRQTFNARDELFLY